jgi:phosphoribosyl 1,2-cyclic phosphodiesterase
MIENKIVQALRAAQGRHFDTDAELLDFVRQELPFSVRDTYGTNTACVEVCGGDDYVVCDAGTGIRDFGNHVLAAAAGQGPQVYHLFISHLHWDHIQGFPFFVPAYIPGNQIHIYGCHKELQQAFTNQQQSMHFPVSLTEMGAQITFHLLETDKTYQIAGFYVRAKSQRHPGGSYGYSFVKDGKKLVYSTDAEHKEDFVDEQYPFIAFFSAADLVIFDAQYTLLDAIDKKENWGHSSNIVGVELAVRSGVKRLCLFHLEHTHDDDTLQSIAEKTREYLQIFSHGNRTMEIEVAFDGLEISL